MEQMQDVIFFKDIRNGLKYLTNLALTKKIKNSNK